MIPIGSAVYVKTVGLNHKLFDRYKGPFTISSYSKGGNYKLKNVLNKELEGSFPRERLKLVKEFNEEKYFNFEKILEDRISKDGKREFLIQWKNGLGEPTWEPSENFVDLEAVNEYLRTKSGVPKKKVGRPKKDEVKEKPIRKGQSTKRTTRSSSE